MDRVTLSPEEVQAIAARLVAPLEAVAREHGYSLTYHGSMSRDIDIVAVPWAEKCSDHWTLYSALVRASGGREDWRGWKTRPHRRLVRLIDLGKTYIDFSVVLPWQ